MENKLTVVLPQEVEQLAQNVSIEKRNEVQSVLNRVFNGVSKMREQLDSIIVIDENDKVNMKLANTIRLGVRQERLDAEKEFDSKRGEVQQAMLSFKTEDALWLKAKQTMQILTKEIEENAKWKENTKERIEAEKKELEIQSRILKIQKFNPELERSEFENMGDETFNVFLSGIEKAYNDRIEAERKAEEKRLADIAAEKAEQERIRKENEVLRQRAIDQEKKAEAERKANEEKLQKIEAENNRIRLENEAKAKAAADKVKAENEKELAIEKAKAAKLQAEIEAKADAERKAKAAEEAHLQAELNKGDVDKMQSLIDDLKALQSKYSFKSVKNISKMHNVNGLIEKVITYIKQ